MATTQEFYRIGGRLPRYATKLSAFANGMYLTNQVIPEGYAKVMVNYDIDDTGSNIKPRAGREKVQLLDYSSNVLGPASFTDYLYAYNKDNSEVEDLKDVVLSYGLYTDMSELVNIENLAYDRPVYIASMHKRTDTTAYTLIEDAGYQVLIPGVISEEDLKEFWSLYYDKEQEQFKKIDNKDIGYITARTVTNAYAFDKPFKGPVGRPIGTVLNNEIITFSGPNVEYEEYTANPERSSLLNFGNPTLTKLIITNEGNKYTIKRQMLDATSLNAIEAYSSGFNMLHEAPYVFQNEEGSALSVLGAVPYDPENPNIPVFVPKLGNKLDLHVTYAYPKEGDTIKYKVEVLDLTNNKSEWEVLTDFKESFTAGEEFYYTYIPKYKAAMIRFTLRIGDDSTTDDTGLVPIDCTVNYGTLEPKTFDLSTCKGVISWLGCLGVYGVVGAENSIFFSDVENPSYFPYPYNVIEFDNEILAVHNYLDFLLVITVDSVWLVTAGETINTSTQKRILANVHIPEIDAINLVVLKDQIFFKTDTQFYVLKPNQYTSDATDLKNYVNSTAISNLTQNFTASVVDILNQTYKTIWQKYTRERRKQIRFEDFDVLDTRSVIRNEEVHYIYTITPKLTDGIVLENLNLHFVYNTLTRSWRIYFCVIGDDDTYYNPVLYKNKQSGAYYEFFPHTKSTGGSGIVVSKQSTADLSDNLVQGDWTLTEHYDNFNYIDTGNIALDDANTKRFREVQLNLVNMEHTKISFYADFKVDGQERVQATNYVLQHITDNRDPDYGQIYITPIEETNIDLYGTTVLAESDSSDHWELDLSRFPDLNMATVRFNLQGRGRRGSLQLLNTSLKRYELSDINWVYRTMSGR